MKYLSLFVLLAILAAAFCSCDDNKPEEEWMIRPVVVE